MRSVATRVHFTVDSEATRVGIVFVYKEHNGYAPTTNDMGSHIYKTMVLFCGGHIVASYTTCAI